MGKTLAGLIGGFIAGWLALSTIEVLFPIPTLAADMILIAGVQAAWWTLVIHPSESTAAAWLHNVDLFGWGCFIVAGIGFVNDASLTVVILLAAVGCMFLYTASHLKTTAL